MTSPVEPVSDAQSTPSPETQVPAIPPTRSRCGTLAGCTAAVLGGVLTWGLLQTLFPVFEIPEELQNLPSPQPSDLAVKAERAFVVATRWNATLLFAILGVTIAAFLAVAESVSQRCAKSAWWRSPLSGCIAGLAGAVAGLSASLLLESPQVLAGMSPLAKTISVQCLGLGLLGLGTGLGVGITGGWSRLLNAGVGGALGGLLVGFLYPTGMGFLLPNTQTEHVVPIERSSQLIWSVAISLLIGMVITSLGRSKVNGQT